MKNNTLTYRVEQLEKIVDKFDNKLDMLSTNEVPHLQIRLTKMELTLASLKSRVTLLTGLNIGAIIVGILIAKYL
jgi:hypothetical protein